MSRRRSVEQANDCRRLSPLLLLLSRSLFPPVSRVLFYGRGAERSAVASKCAVSSQKARSVTWLRPPVFRKPPLHYGRRRPARWARRVCCPGWRWPRLREGQYRCCGRRGPLSRFLLGARLRLSARLASRRVIRGHMGVQRHTAGLEFVLCLVGVARVALDGLGVQLLKGAGRQRSDRNASAPPEARPPGVTRSCRSRRPHLVANLVLQVQLALPFLSGTGKEGQCRQQERPTLARRSPLPRSDTVPPRRQRRTHPIAVTASFLEPSRVHRLILSPFFRRDTTAPQIWSLCSPNWLPIMSSIWKEKKKWEQR